MHPYDATLQALRTFVAEREWRQFHDPKNLAMAIASEAGELLAEYRWIPNAESDQLTKSKDAHARVVAEAADIGIALLLLCDRIGVDLLEAIRVKMATNAQNYPVEQSKGKAERPPR